MNQKQEQRSQQTGSGQEGQAAGSPPPGNPRWLKWAVLLFLGYAVFTHYTQRQEARDGQNSVLGVGRPPDSGPGAGVFSRADFGSYNLPEGVRIGGDIPGRGPRARCGQTAAVTYRVAYPEGAQAPAGRQAAPNPKQRSAQLQVGLAPSSYPWSPGIVGMQPGGIRQIQVRADKRYPKASKREQMGLKPDAMLRYTVELRKLRPHAKRSHVPFQAMVRQEGYGERVRCGATVDAHVRIWGRDGAPRFDTRDTEEAAPLTLRVGQSRYLYGLDRGLLHMQKDEVRTLIVPPAYAEPTQAASGPEGVAHPLAAAVRPGDMVVAEVHLIDVRFRAGDLATQAPPSEEAQTPAAAEEADSP